MQVVVNNAGIASRGLAVADTDPAELERVAFTTSAGVHGSTLAEFALFGILAGAKDLRRLEAEQAARHWPAERWAMRHLDEMTVLIVGLGGIGAATAARFKACGSTVWGTSRSGRPVDGVDRVIPLDELAATTLRQILQVWASPAGPSVIARFRQALTSGEDELVRDLLTRALGPEIQTSTIAFQAALAQGCLAARPGFLRGLRSLRGLSHKLPCGGISNHFFSSVD